MFICQFVKSFSCKASDLPASERTSVCVSPMEPSQRRTGCSPRIGIRAKVLEYWNIVLVNLNLTGLAETP